MASLRYTVRCRRDYVGGDLVAKSLYLFFKLLERRFDLDTELHSGDILNEDACRQKIFDKVKELQKEWYSFVIYFFLTPLLRERLAGRTGREYQRARSAGAYDIRDVGWLHGTDITIEKTGPRK